MKCEPIMKLIAKCGTLAAVLLAMLSVTTTAAAQNKKPNLPVIWGDDIGHDNISAYPRGLLGSRTPNIDRIAKEGALFTDYYGQASCTAGRANVPPHGTRHQPGHTSLIYDRTPMSISIGTPLPPTSSGGRIACI